MVREKGKGNSFRPPCLLEGMHLSALCQPEVDLRINIMKQKGSSDQKEQKGIFGSKGTKGSSDQKEQKGIFGSKGNVFIL